MMIGYWARSIRLILLLAFCLACQKVDSMPIATIATLPITPTLTSNYTTPDFSLTHPTLAPKIVESKLEDEAQLIDIRSVNPNIVIDIRYATENNFMQRKLYRAARCVLRVSVARKLSLVQADLEKLGLGLKVYDCYRPLSVQRQMWRFLPDARYVANPTRGSRHNRGAAVDVTLVDRNGNELEMPTGYDNFTVRSHRNYRGTRPRARRNRQLLEAAMKNRGFISIRTEWWHFDAANWRKFSILDLPL